jgi:hypothetical protein
MPSWDFDDWVSFIFMPSWDSVGRASVSLYLVGTPLLWLQSFLCLIGILLLRI